MACFGRNLLLGIGGPQDNAFGLVNVTEAAGLGSEFGAHSLGRGFFVGGWGLPKDHVRARFWLEKVVNGECEFKHLSPTERSLAEEILEALGPGGE